MRAPEGVRGISAAAERLWVAVGVGLEGLWCFNTIHWRSCSSWRATLKISLHHKCAIAPASLAQRLLSFHPQHGHNSHMEKLQMCFQGSLTPRHRKIQVCIWLSVHLHSLSYYHDTNGDDIWLTWISQLFVKSILQMQLRCPGLNRFLKEKRGTVWNTVWCILHMKHSLFICSKLSDKREFKLLRV